MPSARVHEVIAKKINKEYKMDELLLRIGTVAPDCWRNTDSNLFPKDKYMSHFWDFRVKKEQANGYLKFYLKYYNKLDNPFYFGYLLHLIVDDYWKLNIDKRYFKIVNDELYIKQSDDTYKKDNNSFYYNESIKMQKRLAKKFDLYDFPIYKDKLNIPSIDEIDLSGLFGTSGTLSYINNTLGIEDTEESTFYKDELIMDNINETISFVKNELNNLKQIKCEMDKKVKIAINLFDIVLLLDNVDKYFNNDNPLLLMSFLDEYFDEIISINKKIINFFKTLNEMNVVIDLVSIYHLECYSPLMKKIVLYLDSNNIKYNFIYSNILSICDFVNDYDIYISSDYFKTFSDKEFNKIYNFIKKCK